MEMSVLLKRPSKVDYDIDAFAIDLQNFARDQRDRYIRLYGQLYFCAVLPCISGGSFYPNR